MNRIPSTSVGLCSLALLVACTEEPVETQPLQQSVAWVDALVEEPVGSFSVAGPTQIAASYDDTAWLWSSLQPASILSLTETQVGPSALDESGTWVVLNDELLLFDGALRQVDWADSIGIVDDLQVTEDALWLHTDQGLFRRADDALLRIDLDGEPVTDAWAVGDSIDRRPVVWLASEGLVVAVDAQDGSVLDGADLRAPVRDLAAPRGGPVTARAGDQIYRHEEGQWNALDLGSPATALWGRPDSDAVWIGTEEGWVHATEDTLTQVGQLDPPVLGTPQVDVWGRLVWTNADGLWRAAADRPIEIGGVRAGSTITAPLELPLLPTNPDAVTTLVAEVLGAGELIELPMEDGNALLDPLGLVFGRWTIRVRAEHSDGASGQSEVVVHMAAASGATWTEHIEPIYRMACAKCHDGASETVLDSPQDWADDIENILSRVSTGQMPLAGEPLTDSEIALIQAWAAGGFTE